MTKPEYDVTGIGNAIVDVLSFTDEDFIKEQGLVKGTMTLVDEERSALIYRQLGQATECSGGSVANTLAGMASLGANTAFIGKIGDDQLGSIFTHDMHAVGVHFDTPPSAYGPSTANCLVCVTPDAERTMATFIGACSLVSEDDIDEALIAGAAITYIEGYLWDTDNAKAAIRKAIRAARKAGRKIAFTLSDTFCIERHRKEFLQLVEEDIDILFANENEMASLYQTKDIDAAIAALPRTCGIVAITRGEHGSVVLSKEGLEEVSTTPVARIVDTTGAGDLYAAGFLYAYTRGRDLAACAALGNRCAGEIITQLGARSQRSLKDLAA